MIYALNANSAAGTSGTDTGAITLPAYTPGDLLLAVISHRSGNNVADIPAPTGWTLLDSQNRTTVVGLWVFYKLAVASESNPTFAFKDSGGAAYSVGVFNARIVNLRNLDITTQVDTVGAKGSGANGNIAFGTFTANQAPVVAVAVCARAYASAAGAPASYTSWMTDYSGTTSSGVGMRVSALLDNDTSVAAASSTNTYAWAAIHFGLRPRALWSSGNGSLFLDPVDDTIQLATSATTGAGTVEFWVRAAKRLTTDSYGGVVARVSDGTNSVTFEASSTGFRVTGGAGTVNTGSLTNSPHYITEGSWYHVAIVWGAGETSVYINPRYGTSPVFSSSTALDHISGAGIGYLGSATAAPGTEYDRIRVWNDARTATELWADRYTTSPAGDNLNTAYYWDDSTAPAMGEHLAGGAPLGIAVEKGAFTLSMKAAALVRGYILPVDAVSFVVTGNDVLFDYTPTRRDLVMAADVASFLLTGQDVILRAARVMPADVAAFTLAGQDITFGYTPTSVRLGYISLGADAGATGAYTLTVDVASFLLTGQDATLAFGRVLPAEAAAFSLTGQDVLLTYIRHLLMAAEAAAFTVTGNNADLVYSPLIGSTYTLAASPGSFVITGNDVILRLARQLAAGAGVFEVIGNDAVLRRALRLAADGGAFTVTGNDAALARRFLLAAASGEFAVTGQDAAFAYARRLFTEPGRFTITGQPATLVYTPTAPGSLVLVLDAMITRRLLLDAEIARQLRLNAAITDRITVESHV